MSKLYKHLGIRFLPTWCLSQGMVEKTDVEKNLRRWRVPTLRVIARVVYGFTRKSLVTLNKNNKRRRCVFIDLPSLSANPRLGNY